jgi:putative ABC transport system permease protein
MKTKLWNLLTAVALVVALGAWIALPWQGVLAMVLAESVLLLLLGGVIGLVLAALLIPVISAGSGGMLNLPGVGTHSWLLGIGLMAAIGLMVGSLPAWSAMRLNIVDALAGR